MTGDELRERVQAAIWKLLGERSALNPKPLLKRISKETGLDPLDVQRSLARLSREGWLKGVADNGMPFAQVIVQAPRPVVEVPPTLVAWRRALAHAKLAPEEALALEPCHGKFIGMGTTDLNAIVAGLIELRRTQAHWAGTAGFIVSARLLLGSSKILPDLPASALASFGIEMSKFPPATPYLVVAGPAVPTAVLLIENPQVFEAAIRAGLAVDHALIVTFGYGLNPRSDDFGRQLAEQIESRIGGLIALRRDGSPPDLPRLFAHEHLFFWGDLDREGMRIYRRLQPRLPQLRLSALYGPMHAALLSGVGHPYVAVTAKDQQRLPTADERVPDDAMALFRACAERGLDQEWLDVTAYAHLAALPLHEA